MDTRFLVETVKTRKFLIVIVAACTVSSGLGATVGTLLFVNAGQNEDFGMMWTEWFVGTVSLCSQSNVVVLTHNHHRGRFSLAHMCGIIVPHASVRHRLVYIAQSLLPVPA